ncbi:retrotransposon protein, putative, ty1-copia subclass [Tanacetum coccineum]
MQLTLDAYLLPTSYAWSFSENKNLLDPTSLIWYKPTTFGLLSSEDKENTRASLIPVAPVANAGQQVPPEALALTCAWVVKGQRKLLCYAVNHGTDIQRNLVIWMLMTWLQELKLCFSKQVETELCRLATLSTWMRLGQQLVKTCSESIFVALNMDFALRATLICTASGRFEKQEEENRTSWLKGVKLGTGEGLSRVSRRVMKEEVNLRELALQGHREEEAETWGFGLGDGIIASHSPSRLKTIGVSERRKSYTHSQHGSNRRFDKTPYEIWMGSLSLSYLKVWGCEALVKRDTLTKPDKLDPRSFRCIFVGYPKETMGYSFYNPSENKVFVARNAEFFENDLIDLKQARLCSKGASLNPKGVDYENLFPVAVIRAIRILIAIVAYYGLDIGKWMSKPLPQWNLFEGKSI